MNGKHFFFEQINPTRFYRAPESQVETIFVVTYNATKQEALINLPLPQWIEFPILGEIG